MKTTLLLLLASGLPLAACAANQSVDLELALGVADTHQGSSNAAQVGMIWFPDGRLGVEAWFGHGSDESLDAVPGPTNDGTLQTWVDRMQGVGLRYQFFGNEERRWQPFVRLGWARADVRFEGIGRRYLGDDTFVFDRFEFQGEDESVYYGIGSAYALTGGWSVSAQVLHVPVKIAHLQLDRTEALIGIQYAF